MHIACCANDTPYLNRLHGIYLTTSLENRQRSNILAAFPSSIATGVPVTFSLESNSHSKKSTSPFFNPIAPTSQVIAARKLHTCKAQARWLHKRGPKCTSPSTSGRPSPPFAPCSQFWGEFQSGNTNSKERWPKTHQRRVASDASINEKPNIPQHNRDYEALQHS